MLGTSSSVDLSLITVRATANGMYIFKLLLNRRRSLSKWFASRNLLNLSNWINWSNLGGERPRFISLSLFIIFLLSQDSSIFYTRKNCWRPFDVQNYICYVQRLSQLNKENWKVINEIMISFLLEVWEKLELDIMHREWDHLLERIHVF